MAYRDFWISMSRQMQRSRQADGTQWELPRTVLPTDTRLGWSKAAADTLPRPLEVIIATEEVDGTRVLEGLVVTELSWRLHDHGVLLVEGRLRTAAGTEAAVLGDANHWEGAVQRAGRELSRSCAERVNSLLAEEVSRTDDAGKLVDLEQLGVGEPLWVTRSLAFDPLDETGADFARAWVSGIDAHHTVVVEDLIVGDVPLVAQWMNHVHRPDQPEPVELSWRALRKAQFFWSALHWVDDSLREILAWTMADRKDLSVRDLRLELRKAMIQAQELLMLRADVRQHVSRRTHEEMQRFLGIWEYTELLEDPVREKVEICKERLGSLAEDRAARSAMFTDIILMSIGVTSVLATAIALVQFGRDAGGDPSQSVFDLGNGTITSWLSSQSMDAILIISLLLSTVLVAVFIWKRRQSVS
ncbi:MAG: hypothetical protein L0G99_09070 [Propionibacteriales bacterium]|nr:hypothetical protein [Propionibacteriales bacterium]